MREFSFQNGVMHCEDIALDTLAEQFGTPLYVYSRKALQNNFLAYKDAMADQAGLICYAVKANGNLAILNELAKLGAGFDIVSSGELKRVLAAGGLASKTVFSGVAKSVEEMTFALEQGIHCFNVESRSELITLNKVASSMNKVAPVSIRVNPNVDAKTHPYISTGSSHNKFGIDINEVSELYQFAAKELTNLDLIGVDCHIGSQITDDAPLHEALGHLLNLIDQLKASGIELKHVDLGGGIGVSYTEEDQPPTPAQYLEHVKEQLKGRNLELILEPGRSIVADTGMLLTQVRYIKETSAKNFAIIDAAMNDMARPALYQAWMNIQPTKTKAMAKRSFDVVGPICETGDFLGKDRDLAIEEGDYLGVYHAGAYGFTMSSNYNARTRAAEILVDGSNAHLVRKREVEESLYELEQVITE